MSKYRLRFIYTLLSLLILSYTLFFTAQLLGRYNSFAARSLDLANMDQAIWNTLHGRPFHQTNQPGVTNRLSLHVEPILLPISLLYLIYSGPPTLFVVETLIVALGALPVFALARHKLKNDGLALIFAAVYLLYPPLQAANMLDFHPVTLAPTFLLAAFYYLDTDRPGRFALFAALAASCKEEIALQVMLMGVYALLIKKQPRLGLTTIALALVWTAVAVFIIPPLFAKTQNIHWGRYDHLGGSPVDIVLNFFVQPWRVFNHLRDVNALTYLRLLLTPTVFTALFSPVTLLLALPSLGINLLSNFPPMQEVNTLMYAAPIIPAIFISSIYGTANVLRITYYVLRNTQYVIRPIAYTLGLLLLTASLLYHVSYGYLPGGGHYEGWPPITDHHRRAASILAQIPPEAALSAQDRLSPHASQRQTLHIFDGNVEDVDHIVLDITEDSWPLHPVELRDRVNAYLAGGFGVAAADDGYLLLAKQPGLPTLSNVEGSNVEGSNVEGLPDNFFDFARAPDPAHFTPQFSTPLTFDNKIKLLGYDLTLDPHQFYRPALTFYWQALEPLTLDYTLWPFILDRDGHLIEDTSERPLVTTLWYPTSRWSPGEIILTRTLPRDLGDEFVVNIGIATRKWSTPEDRLRITQADPALYLFEGRTWARLGAFRRTGQATYTPAVPAPPGQPQRHFAAQFGGLITLSGVDLPATDLRPGQPLPLTLYWQSSGPVKVDLTTFVHVLDSQGNKVAQLDRLPQDALGALPTTAWQPARPVVDHLLIPLPDALPPGQYRLIVGWYYGPTGERVPLTAGGNDDVVEVGAVTVR